MKSILFNISSILDDRNQAMKRNTFKNGWHPGEYERHNSIIRPLLINRYQTNDQHELVRDLEWRDAESRDLRAVAQEEFAPFGYPA